MFVYKNEQPNKMAFRFFIPSDIKRFVKNMNEEFHTNFEIDYLSYEYFKPEVEISDYDYPHEGDWCPQFSFRISRHKKGIYLHAIKFPRSLHSKGLGTYCVNWLKWFSKKYGFHYIVLGDYEGAYEFWHRMGFEMVSDDEQEGLYPYY